MGYRITIFLLLVQLYGSCQSVVAQSPAYETISTAQGLSQGMVFDLLQDKEGFIWVATKSGLNRYDGYSFTVFYNDPYDPHSLSSNTILKIYEDRKGRIWAGTEDAGLNVYDKMANKFYRIAHNPSDAKSLSGNLIRRIEELPDGRMLIGTDAAGVDVVETGGDFFKKGAAPVVNHISLPNGASWYGGGIDPSGRHWMGDKDGAVYQFSLQGLKPRFVKNPNARLMKDGYLTLDNTVLINNQFFLDDGQAVVPLFDTAKTPMGNLLFASRYELQDNHYRGQWAYHVAKRQPDGNLTWTNDLPTTPFIYPFVFDRSGIAWSGSVGYGLRKYYSAKTKFSTHLPGYSVRRIVPSPQGGIYLGDFGANWRKLDGDSVQVAPFNNMAAALYLHNVFIAKSGTYWFRDATSKDYFYYRPQTGKLTPYPAIIHHGDILEKQEIFEDRQGWIWVPGSGGWFTRVHESAGVVDSFRISAGIAKPLSQNALCTAIYQDADGTFWAGWPDGFARLQLRETGQPPVVKWFANSSSTRNSLNYNHVSCFLDDPLQPDTYLWIGTKGGGLNRMNKKTGDFIHLTTKDGLPHNVVYGILADDAGNIWGSTNNGIFCLLANTVAKGKPQFRNFTKAYGLQDDEFNTGAYKKLPNGDLAFGGVNGLNIFNPAKVLAGGFTPPVFITSVQVNNTAVSAGDKTGILKSAIEATQQITLNHTQDILTLEFASLDFTAPAQNRYRYQLIGIDKDWVESGPRRTATYLHLPAGDYVFKVQGSNSQGIWSDKIAELKITVLPPWWLTWWAYAVYAVLIALAGRAYLRYRLNRAKLREQLNYEQREAKRVKELDNAKTRLYTNITHEFRTPLTVILGTAGQLLEKPGEQFTAGMNAIIRNGQSLLKLVNEMLDLSKLETGKMVLQPVNGDVILFLRYLTESFHALAEGGHKRLHFLTELETLHVAYDPEKLRQIVANLLSNALKFTPEGGNISITTSKNELPNDEPNLTLIIKVKDSGIGIPANQAQNIFNRFFQLDNSHTRTAEGTGIGLSLTKELVKLMEGEIMVKSPPGGVDKGSEFTVILPMMQVAADNTIGLSPLVKEEPVVVSSTSTLLPHQNGYDKTKPLVLLVEDNADVAAYTASCLPHYGLAIGKNGREGIAMAKELIPDLIITDVMMPFVDGFQLTQTLKTDEHTSHIPIIMLTAKADAESKMEGLQSGADAYLQKPFHQEELCLRIEKLLELRAALQRHYQRKAGITKESAGLEVVLEKAVPATKTEDAFVKKVREAVEANLANAAFTVEDLCKLVFMSHSQLHRKLDALTGYSPNKFIRIIRLSKAKELLQDPSASIGAIALDCGFNDPGYFARVFKQEFGTTPQEWRTANVATVNI